MASAPKPVPERERATPVLSGVPPRNGNRPMFYTSGSISSDTENSPRSTPPGHYLPANLSRQLSPTINTTSVSTDKSPPVIRARASSHNPIRLAERDHSEESTGATRKHTGTLRPTAVPASSMRSRFTITSVPESPNSVESVHATHPLPSQLPELPRPSHVFFETHSLDTLNDGLKRAPSAPNLSMLALQRRKSERVLKGTASTDSSPGLVDKGVRSPVMASTAKQPPRRGSSSADITFQQPVTATRPKSTSESRTGPGQASSAQRASASDAILNALADMSLRQKQHGEMLAVLHMIACRQQDELQRVHLLCARQQQLLERVVMGNKVAVAETDDLGMALAMLDIENEGLRREVSDLTAQLSHVRMASPTRPAVPAHGHVAAQQHPPVSSPHATVSAQHPPVSSPHATTPLSQAYHVVGAPPPQSPHTTAQSSQITTPVQHQQSSLAQQLPPHSQQQLSQKLPQQPHPQQSLSHQRPPSSAS